MDSEPLTAWQKLVIKYADGRTICNCGDAYYDETGNCAYGCSANCLNAQEYIAKRVLDDQKNN